MNVRSAEGVIKKDELKEMGLGHIQWLLHLPLSTQPSTVRKWRNHHGAVPLMHAHVCTHTYKHTPSVKDPTEWGQKSKVDTWEHKCAVM